MGFCSLSMFSAWGVLFTFLWDFLEHWLDKVAFLKLMGSAVLGSFVKKNGGAHIGT